MGVAPELISLADPAEGAQSALQANLALGCYRAIHWRGLRFPCLAWAARSPRRTAAINTHLGVWAEASTQRCAQQRNAAFGSVVRPRDSGFGPAQPALTAAYACLE